MLVIISFVIWASLSVAATEIQDPYALLDLQFPSCQAVGMMVRPVCRPELLLIDKRPMTFECG